ncbi:hypothetical protein A4A49_09312 [Nicotiana attenuata]|uniref:Uncharacterized protein n=1 Tax=Nicotiana attenuata TaxID=49451 RepID=A0A1J6I8X1_NICAT|nr:hypothetical protein A4A49_09312 [Nicotiana attenuata]
MKQCRAEKSRPRLNQGPRRRRKIEHERAENEPFATAFTGYWGRFRANLMVVVGCRFGRVLHVLVARFLVYVCRR